MAQRFNAQLRRQQEWGWLLSTWLFLSGTGSCLFLVYEVFGLPVVFARLSLGIIILGGIVLLLELGAPGRAWRGVSKLSTSWLSRGALSVSIFVASSALYLAPAFPAFSFLSWGEASAVAKVLEWIAILSALMITLYPGIFLSQNRSIPFWNTPWLVLAMVINAWLGANAVVLLGAGLLKEGSTVFGSLAWVMLANIVVTGLYLWLMERAGGAARESVRLLTREEVSRAFWVGVVLVGMIVPLALVVGMKSATVLTGLCLLVGGFLFRYCVLKVGVYVPSTVVQEGVDFSKLNRTSNALLEKEYAAMAANVGRRA